jgi:translation initiation factor 2 subunit 2
MSDENESTKKQEEGGVEEEADVAALLDLSKKKKKKGGKSKPGKEGGGAAKPGGEGGEENASAAAAAAAAAVAAAAGTADGDDGHQRRLLKELDAAQEMNLADDRKASWSYDDLLDRVVEQLHANNPDLIEKKRTRIKPPHLTLLSSKKTLWVNFQEICTMMGRDPNHVYQFFMAELGTEGSIDGNQRLIIRGKYVSKYIESLLRKYVVEYVTCEMCRSPRTELVKDPASRLFFCNCLDCGSRRSVAPIRSGYHATSRADRRAARNAKG